MKSVCRWTVALVVLSVGVAAVAAEKRAPQERSGFRLMLLRQKSVQDDLKVSAEEARKIDEFTTKQWERFRGMGDLKEEERLQQLAVLTRENQEFVKSTLNPEQVKRLHQIGLQLAGPMAIQYDPETAKALKLTDEQKQQLKAMQDSSRKEMQAIFQGSGSNDEKQAKWQALHKTNHEKLTSLLTSEQKETWKDLTGTPFKGEVNFIPPGAPEKPSK